MVMARSSIVAMGQMQAAFLVQFAYAVFTWLIAALVIKYQSYDIVQTGIQLKSGLLDFYIFFVVYLFGLKTPEECIKVIKWMLIGAVFANLATIFDTYGIVNLGYKERLDGRTQGAIGESNQYAAYIILFIPGMIAAAVASRKILFRFAWLGGAMLSCLALAMTASRGGVVGLVIGAAIGAYLYRHLVSYSRIAGWVLGSHVLVVIALSFSKYGGLMTERLFGQTASIDPTEASSGRTEIWTGLFATMMQSPITFITGFGWNVYWSMPFHFSPHNHYFALWFNLGLIGLITGCYLLFGSIARAHRASLQAKPPLRGQLIAFVIGATAVCGAVFFVDLHDPWDYFWMYAGAVMRLAMCVMEQPVASPLLERMRSRLPAQDTFGWAGASSRRLT